MATLELKHFSHKVGVNVHHLEWCTKYRYQMLLKPEYKNACEDAIRKQAERHHITIRELFVMPEHIHVSCEVPPSMSQSKALQLLKGGSSYLLFRAQPKFRLRYPRGHFWSPGAYAGSAGYNTVDIIDKYVRNQEDIHQQKLADFNGSPAPSEARSCEPQRATL
jgi:putative transposase